MKRRNRRRRITHGVPTILEGYYEQDLIKEDNAQVWEELGLAKSTEEGKDDDYHLTNYWLNNADEPSRRERKIKRMRKRSVDKIIEQTPISPTSEEKSMIAHIRSAENFSLLIEVDDDSRRNGWFHVASCISSDDIPRSANDEQQEQSNDWRPSNLKMDCPLEMNAPSALDNASRSGSPSHRPRHEIQLQETESSFCRLSIDRPSTTRDGKGYLSPCIVLSKVKLTKERLTRSHSQETDMVGVEHGKLSRRVDTSSSSSTPSSEQIKPVIGGADFTEPCDPVQAVRPTGATFVLSENENPSTPSWPCLHYLNSGASDNERRKSRLWHRPLVQGESSSDAHLSSISPIRCSREESRKRDRLSTDRDFFSNNSPSVNIVRQSSVQGHLRSSASIEERVDEIASPLHKSLRKNENFVVCSMDTKIRDVELEPKVDCSRDIHTSTNRAEAVEKRCPKSTMEPAKHFGEEVFEVTNSDLSRLSSSIGDRMNAQTFSTAMGRSEQSNMAESVSDEALDGSIIAKQKRGTTGGDRCTEQLLTPSIKTDPVTDMSRRISTAFRNENVELGRLSMNGAIDEFRLPLHPFSTSTPLRPDVVKCPPFNALTNKSLLASIISENDDRLSQSVQNSTADRSPADSTSWRSRSIHHDSVICSSGYWGIVKEKRSTLRTSNIINKQDISRNLSIHNEDPDRIPFFLNGFPLWSKSYAKERNFEKELLFMCEQEEALSWRKLSKILDMRNSIKLGEGSYGEVFTANYNNEPVAIKIIPVGGFAEAKNGQQHSFRLVLPEVIVSRELTDLRKEDNGYRTEGFIELVTICIARGCYPKKLLSAWNEFHMEFRSENESPRIFPSSQCYLVLAYEQGGKSLEDYEVKDMKQAYSIMMQVMVALAVGEERLLYEHRDLHCGNVLISECADQFREEIIASQKVRISMWGARAKIIDFTLSRLKKGTSTIFLNLEHEEEIFEGKGDLQFDIYRLMRKANRNNWARFNPKTNIMWLVYLARYIHKKLEKSSIGTLEERERFVCLFQSLHRFEGSLSERILYNFDTMVHIVDIYEL
uniref:non-specific serine/threonine protein kinase n=1 Tax=Parascaris univalens TaxID=6257 RepID=A0A915BXT9_PARUN